MGNYKGKVYTTNLSTPVTPDQRKRALSIAKKNGMSLAEVGRAALELFFAQDDSEANIEDSNCNSAVRDRSISRDERFSELANSR